MSIQISTELLDGVVLAILRQEDMYGYALTQRIQESLTLSPSTLYPVLRRLKAQHWLITYDKPFQGRNRRYYQITPAGLQQLEIITREWAGYKQRLNYFFEQPALPTTMEVNDDN
ncbi:PadR family transcriptional regulator [Agrilactobacillus yilanensis]|uniref:PadR family transcriptional regulator n=1 Tax=Agrilactobacillus yilanensis TaxID=2485997 RepID=A0ABW4J635_9LACO|nr:PadR family transcriptional regulator [Agrilactobacillus yilanensis]